MADHARKEQRVEPRERAVKAGNKTPVQGKVQIAGVVDFASLAIPPIDHDLGAIGSSKGLGVLHSLPRQLGEGVTENHGATLHLAETVLLAVGRVPDPVHEQVRGVEEGQEVAVPVVGRGVVVGKVDGAVAVAQWHTSQVPEDQHEAPFLVVHVPIST